MDEMWYKQEILVFEIMKTVSLKHPRGCCQVHGIKYQLLEYTQLLTKHHRRNIKMLVKVVKCLPSLLAYPLKKTDQKAIAETTFTSKIL